MNLHDRESRGDAEPAPIAEATAAAIAALDGTARQALERIPDPVVIHCGDEGRIAFANRAALALAGLTSEDEVIGASVFAMVAERDHSIVIERMRLERATLARLPPIRLHLRRANGEVVEVEAHSTYYPETSETFVVARDTSEQRRIEGTLRELEARLALADRLSAVGTLAAGVAHEINNPLSYVSLHLALLREGLEAPARCGECAPVVTEAREHLANVQEGLGRVRTIVRDLRTFTRGDEAELGPTDTNAVVTSTCSLVRNELGKRAHLVQALGALPRAHASDTRLGQVLLNLLLNAMQATPEGSPDAHTITVTTSLAGDGRVCLEVSDTGNGIAPENLARVFAPFFTTKLGGEGTGLGLWVCHTIVSGMGGELSVMSEPERGATFRVLLQPAARPAPPLDVPLEAASVEAPRRLRVLVVDDEPAICEALVNVLDLDHEVTVAGGVREALAHLESAPFDVILADLSMPDGSGVDVLAWLEARADERARRLAFMTGGVLDERTRLKIERAGCPCLDKPFTIDAVRSLVEAVGRA